MAIGFFTSSCMVHPQTDPLEEVFKRMEDQKIVVSYPSMGGLRSRFKSANVSLLNIPQGGEFALCFSPTSSSQLTGVVFVYRLMGESWVFQAAIRSSRDFKMLIVEGEGQITSDFGQLILK